LQLVNCTFIEFYNLLITKLKHFQNFLYLLILIYFDLQIQVNRQTAVSTNQSRNYSQNPQIKLTIMKTNVLSILLKFVLLMCFSCTSTNKNKQEDPNAPYQINWSDFLNKPNHITKLSSFVDRIDYISLKSTDSIKLGRINKIQFTEDKIFILDQTFTIFIFDKSGNLLTHFNHVGRGPGEYPFVAGFTVDEKNNRIAVISLINRTILFYSLDGTFINKIELSDPELFPQTIEWISNDLFALLNHTAILKVDDPMAISSLVIDNSGKVIKTHPYWGKEARPTDAKVAFVGRLIPISEGILVNEMFNDTVYLIDKNGDRSPYIINNYGPYRATRSYLEGPDYNITLDTRHILGQNVLFTQNFYYLMFRFKNVTHAGIWDFKNQIAYSLPDSESNNGFNDDIDLGIPFLYPRGFFKDQLFDLIEPQKIVTNENLKPRPKSQLEKIVNDLKEDDNPIIRILKLKNSIQPE
jgi:hypothetical protein